MDDFNTAVLSEAKNEYSSRLVNILTPLIIQGFKAIFKEAWDLCIKNEEAPKYLMTFQNFLTRVPKWNQEIINVETKRIMDSSKCIYLEDLLTCVHITQLKILTSIRVSSQQKKIDIDIPKLPSYIHKVYICAARKLYQNVYLFEEEIMPLAKQKNMRECEIIVKESILNVIRENMPIEKILRAYIDETEEEEIVEEIVKEPVEDKPEEGTKNADAATEDTATEKSPTVEKSAETPVVTVEKTAETTAATTSPVTDKPATLDTAVSPTKISVETAEAAAPAPSPKLKLPSPINAAELPATAPPSPPSPSTITFNDNDNVINYSSKDDPTKVGETPSMQVSAPKTIERLEKISHERHEQRKLDEEEEDDDDGDSIKISTEPVKLEVADIHDITGGLKLNSLPELSGVEVLA